MAAHKTIEESMDMPNSANLAALAEEQKAASRGAPYPKSYDNFGSQLALLMTEIIQFKLLLLILVAGIRTLIKARAKVN